MSTSKKLLNFYKRWNKVIDSSKKVDEFKIRTINSIINILSKDFRNINTENEFLSLAAKSVIESTPGDSLQLSMRNMKYKFSNSETCKLFKQEDDFVEYVRYLQILFWMEGINEDDKVRLMKSFKEDIAASLINIDLKRVKNDYIFYPVGAKLLDLALVDDVLDWLCEYKQAYASYKNALEKYQNKVYERNLIDDLRLSLELFLKQTLKNNKPLEKQISELGNYFKDKEVSVQIRGMFTTLLTGYTNYQNDNVKHGDKYNDFDIEFLIYLTGLFIRYIIIIENSKEI